MLVGFLGRKYCEVQTFSHQLTRFQSPQIGEKIARKRMSFALFMFQTKLPQHHQMLVFSFLSFLVFLLFKCCLSLLLYGSFSMLRCFLWGGPCVGGGVWFFFCMGLFQCYVVFGFFFFIIIILVLGS